MANLATTFDYNKELRGFYARVYAHLAKKFSAKTLNSDEIFEVINNSSDVHSLLQDYTIIHSPLDFQRQIYFGIRPFNYDCEEKDFDKFSFMNTGTSILEEELNSTLFAVNLSHKKNNFDLYTTPGYKQYDITDKIHAAHILENLGIPIPISYNNSIFDLSFNHQQYLAKPRKGSLQQGIKLLTKELSQCIKSLKEILNSSYLIQERVNIPTTFPSYIRVNVDFGEITGAALLYTFDGNIIPKRDTQKVILLNHDDNYFFQRLNQREKEILEIYELKHRTLPKELINYSKRIAQYCSSIGLQSIGIDYILDATIGKYVCTCDINRFPGMRKIMFEQYKALGHFDTDYCLFLDKQFEDLAIKYRAELMLEPFEKFLTE